MRVFEFNNAACSEECSIKNKKDMHYDLKRASKRSRKRFMKLLRDATQTIYIRTEHNELLMKQSAHSGTRQIQVADC